MQVKPAKRHSLFEQVVESIEQLILDGSLGPGSRLPTERELARRFQVSRTTIRQALAALQAKGLVESHVGSGTYTSRGPEFAVAKLAQALVARQLRLTEALEVRGVLEPFVAQLAAARRTDDDLQALAANLAEQEGMVQRGESLVELDSTFHRLIAVAARNRIILTIVEVTNETLKESRAVSLGAPGGGEASLADHKRIFAAIQAREPASAFRAMQMHLQLVEQLVAEQVRRSSGGEVESP